MLGVLRLTLQVVFLTIEYYETTICLSFPVTPPHPSSRRSVSCRPLFREESVYFGVDSVKEVDLFNNKGNLR